MYAKSYDRDKSGVMYKRSYVCMYACSCMHVCSANAIAIVQRAINPGTYRMYSIHFGNGRHKSPKCSKSAKRVQNF